MGRSLHRTNPDNHIDKCNSKEGTAHWTWQVTEGLAQIGSRTPEHIYCELRRSTRGAETELARTKNQALETNKSSSQSTNT